ncbi:acid phosphatase [Aspergillus heteromorphus CBS 117.55]|uniref:3-phytase n=1 Tax=Aspergillus heteromorphus CBS 117.55 TaxID=1448321 RepID=A0A317WR60_9EURO|nr:acid phosphatase [Aspergillus heteromorphus CBS 117.55]PWY88923.1 acid phosphatase [Aspergillus heteromorphus CBS 117.55]
MAPTPTTDEPDWFQTRPQSYQGYTATGAPPFLAQYNPAPFGDAATYTVNSPLETSQPIRGAKDRNIFHHMGNLSPYYPRADGFGVDEYSHPHGSNITQMHLLHRHGSRYPTKDESQGLADWADKIANATRHGAVFTDSLAFLNTWTYLLGAEVLTTRGRQDLFDSGVLNQFNYGHLAANDGTKIVARTTTQDRMLKSAENFLSGFFGLDWPDRANLLAMIEAPSFNTSLMSIYACPNAITKPFGDFVGAPMTAWKEQYLAHRTHKLDSLVRNYNWTTADSFNAQSLCAYETVALGYSPFCALFSYDEWEAFSYTYDIAFAGYAGFQCPLGRASGITWVEEFLARVQHRDFSTPGSSSAANLTLNENPVTFPTNQSLYLDFAHDNILISVITAFGLRQFADLTLPPSSSSPPSSEEDEENEAESTKTKKHHFPPKDRNFQTSKLVPFGARLNIEIIRSPHAVHPARKHGDTHPYIPGTGETEYVHFLMNQRTVPLHSSFAECEERRDGWCELGTFLKVQKRSLERAKYDFSCVGEWELGRFGDVNDGVPLGS